LTSSDVELVQSIEDFGGRRIQEQHQAPLAQSIQVRKAKGFHLFCSSLSFAQSFWEFI